MPILFPSPSAGKGNAAFEALSRIAASTMHEENRGSSTRQLYAGNDCGVQLWYIGTDGNQDNANLRQLEKTQNKCQRRITAGYKRTPRAALQREARIQPLDIYSESIAMNRAFNDKGPENDRRNPKGSGCYLGSRTPTADTRPPR